MAEQTDIYVGTTVFTDKGDWVDGYKFTYTDPDTQATEEITGYDEHDIAHTAKGVHLSLKDGNTSNPDTDKKNWRTWVDLTALVAAIAAEEIRKKSEAERIANETARKKSFSDMVDTAKAATDSATAAATSATSAAALATTRIAEMEALAKKIAAKEVLKPEEMYVEYPADISIRNKVPQSINARLVPAYYPQNVIFQRARGNAMDVDPGGRLTINGTGDTWFYVIPTNNTALYVEIKITVRQPYIRLSGNGTIRMTNSGFRIV